VFSIRCAISRVERECGIAVYAKIPLRGRGVTKKPQNLAVERLSGLTLDLLLGAQEGSGAPKSSSETRMDTRFACERN